MKIKKDDKVIIIKGKDRSKTAKVLSVMDHDHKLVAEGVNIIKKHVRPKQQNQKGQRVEIEKPIDASNVMIICPKCNKASRIGYKFIKKDASSKKKGKNPLNKVRFCKKCQQEI